MDLEKALKSAKSAAAEARGILLQYYGHLAKVRSKGQEGLVSEADEESEKAIAGALAKDFPEIPMLGEEGAASAGNKYNIPETTWIVDPLDGTTNYIHRFDIWCISIGLQYKGQLVLGVVDVPRLNETFWATKGGGAFLNGEQIQVSERMRLEDSLLSTGFFAHQDLDEQICIFTNLMQKVRGIRRPGAAAYDLCCVAKGVFDGFWERNLKPWDAAAGAVLVREAGGQVLNYEGNHYDVKDKSLLAANKILLPDLLGGLQSCLLKT